MNLLGGTASKATSAKAKILMREVVSATRLGQKALARTLLKELQQEDPDNEQGLMWAAALAESPEEAARHLERALEVNPNNTQALNILAMHRLNPSPRKQGPAPPPEPVAAMPTAAEVLEIASAPARAYPATARLGGTGPAAAPAPPATTRMMEFRELLRKGWKCSLCSLEAPQALRRCTRCGAIFALEDLQALADNRGVDERLLMNAVEEWKKRVAFEPGQESYLNLARAYLNLNLSAEALPWLKRAGEAQPNDSVLRKVVASLQSRRLILAVDDSHTLRRILSIMLERKGFRVLTASDGMQALAKLNEQVPDLILLDITMPRMDGYQVCKVIKQNPYTKHIPVVMLSGNDGFFDKVKGKLAGATDYVTKPFEEEELTKSVKKHMRPEKAATQ